MRYSFVFILFVVPIFAQLEKIEFECQPGGNGDTACTWQCAYYQKYFGAGVCGTDSFCYCKLKATINPAVRQEVVVDLCSSDANRNATCNSKCLTIAIFKSGYCGSDFKCYCLRK